MPTVELTFDQVMKAVRELPDRDRRRLLNEVGAGPEAREVRAAANRLREKYQASPKQRRRMSELLAKGNAGTLTAEQSRELDVPVAAGGTTRSDNQTWLRGSNRGMTVTSARLRPARDGLWLGASRRS